MDIDYQVDDFDNFCIWVGILEKNDILDYQNVLFQFIDDPMYLKQISAAIKMAREGYIEKTKEKSTVYIFYMKNGEVSIINQEQLMGTFAYRRLYIEAMYCINKVIKNKKHKEVHATFIEYRDYLEEYMAYYSPHLLP